MPDVPHYSVRLIVNGSPVGVEVSARRRLVEMLREDLGLTGTKVGCDVGACGVCSVLVDGALSSSCSLLAVQVDGASVTTIEGIADDPEFDKLRAAFIEHGGFQCGFCTSGQLVAVAELMTRGRTSEISEHDVRVHLAGNLCRCTGYYGILRAANAVLRAVP